MTYSTIETDTTVRINQVLSDYFETSLIRAKPMSPAYQQLWENLHKLILSGGKRLRPQMTLLAYEAFGGRDSESILPVAAAQELLHFCLLIHDDIIDRDYIRYGTPNIAGQYITTYEPYVSDDLKRTHYANSAAILGGDLMLSGAYQLIASSTLKNDDKLMAQAILGESIFAVAGGELLDTESSFVPYTPGDALKIATFKTASYSFVGPLTTGAQLAGASSQHIKALTTYADALGIAFQLVDDLLGIYGAKEITGKSTSGDIREGKRTYMAEQATRAMTKTQKEMFDRLYGNPDITEEEVMHIRQLFDATGARQKTQDAVATYATSAREALASLPFSDECRAKFETLIVKVTDRTF